MSARGLNFQRAFAILLMLMVLSGCAAIAQTSQLQGGVEQSQQNQVHTGLNRSDMLTGMQQGQPGAMPPPQMAPQFQQSVQQNMQQGYAPAPQLNMQQGMMQASPQNMQQGYLQQAPQLNMQQGYAQQMPQNMQQGQVNQQPMFQTAGVQGGEEAFGCLGCVIDHSGRVVKVYPESDLNRFQIITDDHILGINGHGFDGRTFPQECIGVPGSMISLAILHGGMPIQVEVHRVDSRELASHGGYYKHWAAKTRQW